MTIKQQGGIFGRNPSFNNVNAVDLEVTNRLGINETSPDARLQVSGSRMNSASEGVVVEGTWPWVMLKDTESGQASFVQYVDAGNYIVKTIPHADKDSAPNGVGTEVFRWNSSGNLALPNGKGIDFSATSGTGTSELFDDYEEGTWTPTYVASTTNPTFSSYGLQQGYYTKVGEMVYVSARMRTNGYNSDGVGNLRIGGLPFTSASIATLGSGGAISILGSLSFTSNPAAGYFISGGNYIQLNSNTLFTTATVSALDTGTADNDISFFGVYRAS